MSDISSMTPTNVQKDIEHTKRKLPASTRRGEQVVIKIKCRAENNPDTAKIQQKIRIVAPVPDRGSYAGGPLSQPCDATPRASGSRTHSQSDCRPPAHCRYPRWLASHSSRTSFRQFTNKFEAQRFILNSMRQRKQMNHAVRRKPVAHPVSR